MSVQVQPHAATGALRLLPFFLRLEEQPALVIGAGAVGTERIGALLDVGARVTVIAPDATPQVRTWHNAGHVDWKGRSFRNGDVLGYRIVVSSTGDPSVDRAVHRSAVGWSIPVSVTALPELSDFHFGSVIRRGPVTVAVSTSGVSPALSRRLREFLEEAVPRRLDLLARLLGRTRARLRAAVPDSASRVRAVDRLLGDLPIAGLEGRTDLEIGAHVADWIDDVERGVRRWSDRR